MIREEYDYLLELRCDECHTSKVWKNKGEYPHNNMRGNKIKAENEGWKIVRFKVTCPRCVRKIKKERKD